MFWCYLSMSHSIILAPGEKRCWQNSAEDLCGVSHGTEVSCSRRVSQGQPEGTGVDACFSQLSCHNRIHRLHSLNNRNVSSLEAASPRSRACSIHFLVTALLLACRRRMLRGLSSECAWRETARSLVSLLIRPLILWDQCPTLMTSSCLNYLLRGPISKYSHTGYQTFNIWIWEGHTNIQSITMPKKWKRETGKTGQPQGQAQRPHFVPRASPVFLLSLPPRKDL